MNGGAFLFILIGAVGLGLQSFFSFLFWRNGEKKYFLRFISYAIATVSLIFAMIAAAQFLGHGSNAAFNIGFYTFVILALAAAGLGFAVFVQETWISKEGKA